MTPPASWFYQSGFKAYNSWDYRLIEPLVYMVVTRRSFPGIVSFNEIWDLIMKKLPERADIVHAKQCISRALKVMGYSKESKRGKAWYRTEPIMLVDIRPVPVPVKRIRQPHHKTIFCFALSNFFPI